MSQKDTNIPLLKALFVPKAPGINKEYVEIMLQEEIAVKCVNRIQRKERFMPFKTLYNNNDHFWLQSGSWEYFIMGEDFATVEEKSVKKTGLWEAGTGNIHQQNAGPVKTSVEQGYGTEAEDIAAMTEADRLKIIDTDKMRLNELIITKTNDPEIVTGAFVDTTRNAALINHTVLMNAMNVADDEAKKNTQDMVNSTVEMVKASTQLVSENILHDKLMNTLVEKSNGTIVQHMTKVFLNGLSFVSFYNKLVSSSSITISKLRVSFADKYKNFYSTLLPHIDSDSLSLERVFYKGLRAVMPDEFSRWAVGFLLHDIGKVGAIEYHEGEAAYNREIVVEHVKLGYNYIQRKTNYPKEAALICGYHHEYYGDVSGYGYFRSYLEQYKKMNPYSQPDACIAFEIEPVLDYMALSYFPAKVLEIIDVYDSVTDSNRAYRKALTPREALTMMREEFVLKHQKIDPILFDIFTLFMQEKLKNAEKQQ